MRELNVQPPALDRKVRYLSGGNQQKVVLAKWLMAQSQILIMDEPTQGIDVGAKEDVHRLMVEFTRERGGAILLISSDLPEVLRMSDRILVMREGRIMGELARARGDRGAGDAACRGRSCTGSRRSISAAGRPRQHAAVRRERGRSRRVARGSGRRGRPLRELAGGPGCSS